MSEIEAHVNDCFEASVKNESAEEKKKKTEEKQGFFNKIFGSKKPDASTTPLLDLNKQPPQNSAPSTKPPQTTTNKTDSTSNVTPTLYPSYAYTPPYYGAPVGYPSTTQAKGYPGNTSQPTSQSPQQPQVLMMNPQTGQYSVMMNPQTGGMPVYYYPQMPQYPQQPQTQPKKN